MPIDFSIQLYSLRDDCAADLLGTLGKVAEMGYKAVEFAGYHGLDPVTIRKRLDEVGLVASGTHTQLDQLDEESFKTTVTIHKTLGTENCIVPWLPVEKRNSVASCHETAKYLTERALRFAGEGLRIGFHAHADDVKKLENGKSAWDILADNTPHSFIMQYDTANAVHGGADPIQPLIDHPGRGLCVHIKEYPWDGRVIGEGQIDWARMKPALVTAGTVWHVVEQEQYGERTPLECARLCLENLRKMGW